MSKAGIKQVAAMCGVSPATVSRTLSHPDIVSRKTREKVLKAVAECGYTPNRFGASLRTQKSGNIVVIIPDITNSFNAGVIRSIEDDAALAGYSVLLGDTQRDPEKVKHYASMLKSGQVDGVLLFSAQSPFDIDENTDPSSIPPLVNTCEPMDLDNVCKVMIDNVGAAKMVMSHLLELGHTRIGAITGNMDAPSSRDRAKGYKQALAEAGIDYDPELFIEGDYDLENGKRCAERLVNLANPPTAIFCFSDNIALGAMNCLHDHGIRIPEDISLVGFDNTQYAGYLNPPLTTVHQPLREIGQHCMRLLLDQMRGKEVKDKYVELPVKLVVRGSTGPTSSAH